MMRRTTLCYLEKKKKEITEDKLKTYFLKVRHGLAFLKVNLNEQYIFAITI